MAARPLRRDGALSTRGRQSGRRTGTAMRFRIERVAQTGNAVLDRGFADFAVHVGPDGVMLYASTGRNGGISGWRIGADGNAVLHTTLVFPEQITGIVADQLILDAATGAPRLFVGADGGGLIAYGLTPTMAVGTRAGVDWATASAAASNGGTATLEALVTMTAQASQLLPPWASTAQIVDLEQVSVQGRPIVLVACADSHTVQSYTRHPQTGALVPAHQWGAADGLGIQAPTAMEAITIGGTTYAVIAASGSSSLTVMRVGLDGRLTPVEHLIDTAATRFAGAQALAVAQANDRAFVVVGGADHGVTLFMMLPDGRLVWLDTLADTAQLSLANVSALEAAVHGGVLHVFVGSQIDGGITHLTVPLDTLGETRTGLAGQVRRVAGTAGDDILMARTSNDTLEGGAGADVLVSGPGRTFLGGDGGADTFVIRQGATRVDILDFQRGTDRLDLGDLPFLRDVAQLTITPTATGARIDYRGVQIHITAANGQPLTAADLFPTGLGGADRVPILPRGLTPEPGREIFGSNLSDTMTGGNGDDTIWGYEGNDTVRLGGGNNLVWGGGGNDTITAGPGNDTIYAGPGDDLVYGWGGNNTLGGGPGNDTVYGGPDAETIFGGDDNDLLFSGGGTNRVFGGEGNDTIWGGDGGNGLGGGPGDDLVTGGMGNDTIWGVGGNDLIHGIGGNNELWGGAGHDTIHGATGNDVLGGGAGNDFLYGGAGRDTIWAGAGDDRMWGGTGADTFVFFRNYEINRILDFNPSEGDLLRLGTGLWQGLGPLTAAQVVQRFGSINQFGNLVLDFSSTGGTTIILVGFNDFDTLTTAIEIV